MDLVVDDFGFVLCGYVGDEMLVFGFGNVEVFVCFVDFGGEIFLVLCLFFGGVDEVFDVVEVDVVEVGILCWYWFVFEELIVFEMGFQYLFGFVFEGGDFVDDFFGDFLFGDGICSVFVVLVEFVYFQIVKFWVVDQYI